MASPYSLDLRQRVVAAFEQSGMSRHQAAARFGSDISTAISWVKVFRQTGSLAPGQMGGHKPRTYGAIIGRVPERGVGAVGKSPAGATAESLA